MTCAINKGLIIDEPWISEILSGRKTWEMRKTSCRIRGDVALIRKGSGMIVGTASIVGCDASLDSMSKYAAAEGRHCIPPERQVQAYTDGWRVPWVLSRAKRLAKPIPYRHPSGAVIWVNLDPETIAAISAQV